MCRIGNRAAGIVALVIVLAAGINGCNTPAGPAGGLQVDYQGSVVQGDGQGGPAGTLLPTQLIVRFDAYDHTTQQLIGPVRNTAVNWSGPGTITPVATTTNSLGEVTADWTLDYSLGSQQLVATLSVSGSNHIVAFVPFKATATGGQALSITGGDQQTDAVGHLLSTPLTVLFSANGLPIYNGVQWSVTTGGGTVSQANTITDATGHTSVQWTLGSTLGQQSVTATTTLPGGGTSSVTFQATATTNTPPPVGCQATGVQHATGITASETWTAAAGPHHVPAALALAVSNNAALTVEAGALVCMGYRASLNFAGGATLLAGSPGGAQVIFTSEDPTGQLPWEGINLTSTGGAPTGFSTIYNALMDYAQAAAVIAADAGHQVLISGTTIQNYTNSALDLEAQGSSVLNSTVDGTGSPSFLPAVILGGALTSFESRVKNALGTALTISAPNVVLQNCEITANRNGVLVLSIGIGASVSIHGCNLTNNAEAAVLNTVSGQFVDAQGNWWGSAAGPSTSQPNAVQNADGSNWLMAPVVLQY